MGRHDRLGLAGQGFFQHGHVQVVLGDGHVDKNRDGAVLNHRGYRGGKACRHRDHLVARADGPFAKKRGGERHEGDQVRRGAGVDQGAVLDAQVLGKLCLELVGIPPGGQPEFQGAVHQVDHFLPIVYPGSVGNPLALLKGLLLVVKPVAVRGHHL